MHEKRSDFVLVMEYKTVSPCNDGARQRAVAQAITSGKQSRAWGEEPEIDEVEEGNIVAEVEHEIMPGALLVRVGT